MKDESTQTETVENASVGVRCNRLVSKPNLALQYLKEIGDTVEDWEGVCGELANAVIVRHGGEILWLEGEIPWDWHMVPLVEGFVHDAWVPDALPPKDWLKAIAGKDAWVRLEMYEDVLFEGMTNELDHIELGLGVPC